MTSPHQALTNEDNELWQRHAEGIVKSVREVFPSVPGDFQLEPVTIRKISGCGMFYDFKMGLPDGQYATVSYHTGGYYLPKVEGAPKPQQKYTVDPTPSASAGE